MQRQVPRSLSTLRWVQTNGAWAPSCAAEIRGDCCSRPLSSIFLSFQFSYLNFVCIYFLLAWYMPRSSRSWFDRHINIYEEYKFWSSSVCNFPCSFVISILLSPPALSPKTPQFVMFHWGETKFHIRVNDTENYSSYTIVDVLYALT
jgi:hypothetical protein